MPKGSRPSPPILSDKHYDAASAFAPESILREARRQKGLVEACVPAVCVLDPDGDMVRQLKGAGRACRDEGWACCMRVPVERGATWTTDAPFRETAETISAMRSKGLLAVEMEAAALCAFARARRKPVLCFAHVTNRMGSVDGDFEKGEADGSIEALSVIIASAQCCSALLGK